MLHQANIIIHVITGTIGILIGVLAYTDLKNLKRHRLYGQVFLGLMGIVVATALIGTLFFIDRPFLTVVAFQSGYFSYSGWRASRRKGEPLSGFDLAVAVVTLGTVLAFLLDFGEANVAWNSGVVYYLLAYLGLVLLFDLVNYFRPILINKPRFWLYNHIFRMTSAFTALCSAGIGTVMAAWEPWNQIIPSMGSTVWLVFCLWYFPRKWRKLG